MSRCSNFLIQAPNGGLEADLFGDSGSAEKPTNVSAKDSIMALFGGQQSQPQFGVPGRLKVYKRDLHRVD